MKYFFPLTAKEQVGKQVKVKSQRISKLSNNSKLKRILFRTDFRTVVSDKYSFTYIGSSKLTTILKKYTNCVLYNI